MDDIRPRGTVTVTCVCGWSFWIDCLDTRLPDGPFICLDCQYGVEWAEPCEKHCAKTEGPEVHRCLCEWAKKNPEKAAQYLRHFVKAEDKDEPTSPIPIEMLSELSCVTCLSEGKTGCVDKIYLTPACHPGAPTRTYFDKDSHSIGIECSTCKLHVAVIAIPRPQ